MILKIISVSSLKTLALEIMTEKCFPGLPIAYIVVVTESGALLLRNLRNTSVAPGSSSCAAGNYLQRPDS